MADIFNFFFESISSVVIICDEQGHILYGNPAFHSIFSKIHADSPEHILAIDHEFSPDTYVRDARNSCLFHNDYFSGEFTIFPFTNQDSGTIHFLYFFDADSNKLTDRIIRLIDEIVVIFDNEGNVLKMNPICDELLPFSRDELLGKNVRYLVNNGFVEKPIILEMIEKKVKLFRNIVYSNGKVIAYTADPYFNFAGEFKGGVLTGRDITRLIDLETSGSSNVQKNKETNFISQSESIDEIKKIISKVAPSDAAIFITGESGVGKEVLAKTIWRNSKRRNKPCVAINCSAIPTELFESELFGYEEGAFTGACRKGKKGLLEEADGGTVFLDEVGELPLNMQTKLLRVIQEKVIKRVGSNKAIPVDVRYISATSMPVSELRSNTSFRIDLFYRLNVIPIYIPPLRERKEDILPIIEYYLKQFNEKYNSQKALSEKVTSILTEYSWPGNVRELKNIMERLVLLSVSDMVQEDSLSIVMNLDNKTETKVNGLPQIDVNGIPDLNLAYKALEQILIPRAIKKYGSISAAAKKLGIDQSTIYRKIKSGMISVDEIYSST